MILLDEAVDEAVIIIDKAANIDCIGFSLDLLVRRYRPSCESTSGTLYPRVSKSGFGADAYASSDGSIRKIDMVRA